VAGVGGFEEDVIEAGAGAEQGIERDTEFLGDEIGGFEADAGDISSEDVGVGLDRVDGIVAVGFVDADRAAGADAVGMEEDHDGADDFLFGPGVLDLFAAFGSDAVDLFETRGSMFDDVEDGVAEAFDEFAGADGTDAADHAAAEVFGDAFECGGRGGADEMGLELEPVFAVADPAALGIDPFSRADGRERAEDGDEIAMTAGMNLEDGEARILVEEGHALDQASPSG
jgi:hypothetical protein